MNLLLELGQELMEGGDRGVAVGVATEPDPLKWHSGDLQLRLEQDVALPRAHDRLNADQMVSVDPERRLARRVCHTNKTHARHSIPG